MLASSLLPAPTSHLFTLQATRVQGLGSHLASPPNSKVCHPFRICPLALVIYLPQILEAGEELARRKETPEKDPFGNGFQFSHPGRNR